MKSFIPFVLPLLAGFLASCRKEPPPAPSVDPAEERRAMELREAADRRTAALKEAAAQREAALKRAIIEDADLPKPDTPGSRPQVPSQAPGPLHD